MLARDVRFEGFTPEDWARLVSIDEDTRPGGPAPPAGGLFVVHDGRAIVKALHTTKGLLAAVAWPAPLARLAEEHRARWVVAAQPRGLSSFAERFAERLRREHDLATQGMLMANIAGGLMAEGLVDVWPASILAAPRIPLRRTLEALVPSGSTALVAFFARGSLHTSVAIERGVRGISRITGPTDLRRALGMLSGDLGRDDRYVTEAAERTFGRVSLGVFAELDVLRAVRKSGSSVAWARAVATRDIVVRPVRLSLGPPLVADAVDAALSAATELVGRSRPLSLALSLWQRWR
jgi:hypothetical protein